MNIGTAWHKLSMLLEDTRCGFSITEVGGDALEHVCSIEVTRYAAEDDFPAYDDEVCNESAASWEGLIERVKSKFKSGEIPKD